MWTRRHRFLSIKTVKFQLQVTVDAAEASFVTIDAFSFTHDANLK